ncbi:hypothetical protein DMN91_005944 [Ooceraea biroi]|uniref:Telomerase reverse transcriptase n=1 Tax=Ooceraea biroi TaxID=2015173 RepID=A0A3L8DMG9_OOCBI|nr:telomerase reverse transcriptase-like [Ooceraea biroi]RLU21571.1 hypothetical protein DMN91_005944 [Ooceraea biroi]
MFPNRKRKYPFFKKNFKTQNKRGRWAESEAKVASSVPLKDYNSMVNLFASRCQMREGINPTKAQISRYHILERGNTGREICRRIIGTHIGPSRSYSNFDNVIPALSPILESFKNQHNRFNYLDKLKFVIATGDKKYAKQKYKNQIHMRFMQTFVKILLRKIIPVELFGTARNVKVLKHTINCLLKTVPKRMKIKKPFKRTLHKEDGTAMGASLDIRPLLKRLDISKINWLHSIESNNGRWIMILKLLHWFFAQYVVKILHKYVVLIPLKGQWVYITKDDWCRMQEEFIKEKESSGALEPWTPTSPTSLAKLPSFIPIGSYKFIPGSSGVRAVFLAKYAIKPIFDDIDVTLRFLQQLYATKLSKKVRNVTRCHEDINKFKESTKNRLYYVCCDIQDAFGSIIQEKLYDIIKMYCRELSHNKPLSLSTCMLSRARKSCMKNKNQNKAQTVLFKDLKSALKNIESSEACLKSVSRGKLVSKIQKLIFQQKVKLNDRVYSIKLGVPQGISTSPILSDIYYQHMINELFSEYISKGFLRRYVDDILYITESEHAATEVLELVRNGIPDYNVKFNPNKIESNVGLPYTPTKIKFLGCDVQF